MIITKKCPMCGEIHTMTLNDDEYSRYEVYMTGHGLLQDMFPDLNPMEREFLKTGYCKNCQSLLFDSDFGSDRFDVDAEEETETFYIVRTTYTDNDNLALFIRDSEGAGIAVITVNLGDELPETDAFIDTNNNPWAVQLITAAGIAEDLDITGQSGFCSYPLFRFDLDKIPDADDEEHVCAVEFAMPRYGFF